MGGSWINLSNPGDATGKVSGTAKAVDVGGMHSSDIFASVSAWSAESDRIVLQIVTVRRLLGRNNLTEFVPVSPA